jgi:hypothetical protein
MSMYKFLYFINHLFWLPQCLILWRRFNKLKKSVNDPQVDALYAGVTFRPFWHVVAIQLCFIHFQKKPILLMFGDEFDPAIRQIAIWVFRLEARKKLKKSE